ncbi:DUF1178 family protein [Sulfitobacter aestuariivivens]|uniref:DUF1178 family protein n=1 Tax=Sulfitobacter aestuariivivens TaxID=2766981 RepID=A0A927D5N4_9RHOB|nr:DUF1178 family protein [Sulfitobacter aestuariivivens]MBD3663702.1 DUF1178 family protein [Sulfitobacter aestuariivivens]
MISYTLKCDEGHSFDSWFQSSSAFEALEKAGHLNCAVCGSLKVAKSLMAPRVATSDDADAPVPVLSKPHSDVEKAVEALRKKVEANSDYVGKDFASQARAMHEGTVPERSIYGEARLDQAKALAEDGVPVMPLPFRPKQKLS